MDLIPIVIPMEVEVSNVELQMEIAVSYKMVEGQPYTGETEVESRLYDSYQLQTMDKVLSNNITVLPITILDVDNPAGGYTVTIGKF